MLVAKALISRLKQQIMVQANDLQFLIGSLPEGIDVNEIEIDDLLQNMLLSNNIPLEMVSMRPDVKATHYELQMKNVQVDVTQTNRYLKFKMSLAGGLIVYLLKTGLIF